MLNKFVNKYNDRFLSPWLVLVMDLIVVSMSLIIAYILRFNFKLPFEEIDALPPKIFFVFSVTGLSFLITKSYVGIIRHTNSADVVKLIFALFISTIVLVIVNIIRRQFGVFISVFIPMSIILIYVITAGSALLLLRLFIKLSYHSIKYQKESQKNILKIGRAHV